MATTRFDDWEGEYLAHFRTKGSKNGVRRYQQEDGTWTPLGLRERKAREGWGDGDERSSSRAEKKAAKAEAKAEKKAARTAAVAEAKEERRKNNIKTMTDEELKAKIERAKMEQEYKELTKSPIRQMGETLLTKYFENKEAKERKKAEEETRKYEMLKMKEQTKQAEIRKAETEARSKADEARASADKTKAETDRIDIESGTRMKQLKLETKRANGTLTITGGFKRMVNTMLTSHGEVKASESKGKSFVNSLFSNRKRVDKYNKNLKSYQTTMSQDPYEWDRSGNNGGKNKNKNKNS